MSNIWLLCDDSINFEESYNKLLVNLFKEEFGDDFEVINIENVICCVSEDGLCVTDKEGNKIEVPRIVYFRIRNNISSNQILNGIILLQFLELLGSHIIDSIEGIKNCENKFIQLFLLKKAGLPVPKTVCGTNIEFENVISHCDVGEKSIIKSLYGSHGKYIFLSLNKFSLRNISGILNHKYLYLFQEYIEYSHGRSLRVNIINYKIYNVFLLEANNDQVQSNIHGLWNEVLGEFPEAEELALKAAECMGLDIAGVDLLFKEDGSFVICEVNQNPCLACQNKEW